METSGTANSFVTSTYLTGTRQANLITALVLTNLRRCAWESMLAKTEEMSLKTWREDIAKKSPTFQYWDLVLEIEVLALILIGVQCSNYFNLLVESLEALIP